MHSEEQIVTDANRTKIMTINEAIVKIAGLVPRLDELENSGQAARDNCDAAASASVDAELEGLLTAHMAEFALVWGDKDVAPSRRSMVCRAAATEPKPAELRKLATASRVGSTDGITLPEGRFAGLSRGKGWCRLGSGPSAQWIDAEDGMHWITEPGRYTVGSSDGFARKEQTPWTVSVCCGYFCAE